MACIHRYTVDVPIPGNDAYRKDINQGVEAVAMGWAHDDKSKCVLQVDLDVPCTHKSRSKKRIKHTHQAKTSYWVSLDKYKEANPDVNEESDDEASESEEADGCRTRAPRGYGWLNEGLANDEVPRVHLVPHWPAWCEKHDEGEAMQAAFCKAGALTSLRVAMAELPDLGKGDLVVCEREQCVKGKPVIKGGKPVRIQEVWTKRAFGPGELLLAPVAKTLMDRHWTDKRSASVDVPAAGAFEYPMKRTLAFDARLETIIDQHGSGSLYWAIQRTEDRKKANLVMQPATVSMVTTVGLPMQKKARTTWAADEVPAAKFLVNPCRIKAKTRLIALEDKVVRAAAARDRNHKAAEKEKAANMET